MVIYACPNCGSRRIGQGALHVAALTGAKDVCRDCNYQGMPLIFDTDKDYQQFLHDIKTGTPSKTLPLTKQEREIIDYATQTSFQTDQDILEKKPYGLLIIVVVTFLYSLLIVPIFVTPIFFLFTQSPQTFFEWYSMLLLLYSLFSIIVIPYGFLKRKQWAYTFAGLLFIFTLPIGLIFLYYLTRPHVKAYFHLS